MNLALSPYPGDWIVGGLLLVLPVVLTIREELRYRRDRPAGVVVFGNLPKVTIDGYSLETSRGVRVFARTRPFDWSIDDPDLSDLYPTPDTRY